ncbi:6-phosphogluconolactonase [uncultured Salinisphaera sp.]|uniref:6-phosphogluconolactonase n=1 Tax=uncultured Salinisphaera sp. TaxID=359372 RepID=UPI0032B1BDEF|tara:strand:+ start:1712 stop:2395 length:684 start_codon:yes stop_codon:yes gene_type:complete
MSEFKRYDDRSQAAVELAASIADTLRQAIAERGGASLVVCGGSSPVELFEHLSQADLDWSQVVIVPSDERWVAPEHADSNERMLRETLLVNRAAEAMFVGLYRDTDAPGDAVDKVEADLIDVPAPFDVVLLGMGDDGHTASLFPNDPNIERALGSTARVIAAEVGPPARLSLGPAVLRRARRIDILIFGDEKKRVHDEAVRPGPQAELPVRSVLNTTDPIPTVHWAA